MRVLVHARSVSRVGRAVGAGPLLVFVPSAILAAPTYGTSCLTEAHVADLDATDTRALVTRAIWCLERAQPWRCRSTPESVSIRRRRWSWAVAVTADSSRSVLVVTAHPNSSDA